MTARAAATLSFAGAARECRGARRRTQALRRGTSALPARQRRQGAPRPEGHHRSIAPGVSTQPGRGRMALQAGDPRAAGQTSQDHAHEQRGDPSSVDFHAARPRRKIPSTSFPGKSFSFRLQGPASRGVHVPLRHQAGADAHRERHVRRDRRRAVEEHRFRMPTSSTCSSRASGTSTRNGLTNPPSSTWQRLTRRQPDWMTFNGYAGQYLKHPLTVDPGDTVRSGRRAGPKHRHRLSRRRHAPHRAWVDSDLRSTASDVQTAQVPAGGGGVFDVKIDQPGPVPVRSHAFASVDQGQVGLLNVGNVAGTMSH